MVTIGPCKGLLEAVTLFGSKASVKRKLETCSPDIGAIWPKECLEFEGARCWTGTETSPYVSMSLSLSIFSGQFPAIFHGQIVRSVTDVRRQSIDLFHGKACRNC